MIKGWVFAPVLLIIFAAAQNFYGFGQMKRLVKVGYVDLEAVKNNFPNIEDIKKKITDETAKVEAEISVKQKALAALENEYQVKSATMTPEQLKLLEMKIDVARKELTYYVKWGEDYVASVKARLITPVKIKINKYIKLISIDQGYSFVFIKGSDMVAYYDEKYDVTGHILYKLKVDLKDEKMDILREWKKKNKIK